MTEVQRLELEATRARDAIPEKPISDGSAEVFHLCRGTIDSAFDDLRSLLAALEDPGTQTPYKYQPGSLENSLCGNLMVPGKTIHAWLSFVQPRKVSEPDWFNLSRKSQSRVAGSRHEAVLRDLAEMSARLRTQLDALATSENPRLWRLDDDVATDADFIASFVVNARKGLEITDGSLRRIKDIPSDPERYQAAAEHGEGIGAAEIQLIGVEGKIEEVSAVTTFWVPLDPGYGAS